MRLSDVTVSGGKPLGGRADGSILVLSTSPRISAPEASQASPESHTVDRRNSSPFKRINKQKTTISFVNLMVSLFLFVGLWTQDVLIFELNIRFLIENRICIYI